MTNNNFFINYIKKYHLGIFIPIFLLFLYPKISHGDYEFYKLIYNNNLFIFDNIFFINDQLTGFVCEYFFGIVFILSSKFITFEMFNFLLDLILFITLINFIKKYINNDIIVFLIIICCSYFFSTALSSVRAELFFILFFLSIINFNKIGYFYLFFFLSFFTHSSLALIYYFFLLLFFYKEIEFLKKLTLIKIVLLLIPILISTPMNFTKIVGYTDQNNKKIESKVIYSDIDNKIKNLRDLILIEEAKLSKYPINSEEYKLVQQRINLLTLEYEQALNKLNNLNKSNLKPINGDLQKIIEYIKSFKNMGIIKFKLLSINLPTENLFGKKSLLLPKIDLFYKIEIFYLLIIIYFHLLIYIFKKRDFSLYLSLLSSIITFGMIGITKASLILFTLVFLIMIKNYELLKKNYFYLLVIFTFLFPFFIKNIFTLNKILSYGRIF